MVHPAVQNFKKDSLEFLGDTGAAHDIGSLRALQDQGVSRDMVEPWMEALQSPVRFATGGGPQLSTEALRVYNKELGDFHIHLLESCPMALSIGQQVSRGRTFIWQHGHKPYIALNHRRCRVWCPSENRWYANRVQNNVPIFAIDSPLKPGKVNKDETKHTHLEQPVACADLDAEDSRTAFCGSCLERQYACVCHDTAVECLDNIDSTEHKDHDADAQDAPLRTYTVLSSDLADEGQVPAVDVSDIAVHPLAYDAIQRRRQHRKDNKRRKWERLKNERPLTTTSKAFDRGATAVETMMSGLRDFFQ